MEKRIFVSTCVDCRYLDYDGKSEPICELIKKTLYHIVWNNISNDCALLEKGYFIETITTILK